MSSEKWNKRRVEKRKFIRRLNRITGEIINSFPEKAPPEKKAEFLFKELHTHGYTMCGRTKHPGKLQEIIEGIEIFKDPMERDFAEICHEANIRVIPHDEISGLDFYIPYGNCYVELKQFHAPRIANQMARQENVIAIQGRGALELIRMLLLGKSTSPK